MSTSLSAVVENARDLNLGATEKYAAIIGRSPSRGARSPVLWNAAFVKLGHSAVMHPMDVESPQLPALMDALRRDPSFVGGAVAVPYKSTVLPLLDDVEPEAAVIGAVNSIYRVGERLVGANTDGEGALRTLETAAGPDALRGATAVVMGLGGAGRAVATYLARAIGPNGRLVLANRTVRTAEQIEEQLRGWCNVRAVTVPPSAEALNGCGLLVNCTTVGYGQSATVTTTGSATTLGPYIPLGPIQEVYVPDGAGFSQRHAIAATASINANLSNSLRLLASLRADAFVFDVIYQPKQTLLLALAQLFGYRTLNGEGMNLEQAVLAFARATSQEAGLDTVRDAMRLAAGAAAAQVSR